MATEESGIRIKVEENGPYIVRGGARLVRRAIVESEHGEPMTWETTAELPSRASMTLCRCGESSTKPFCDDTHLRNGFDGTEAAPTNTYDDRADVYESTGVVVRDDRSICEKAGFCGNALTSVWDMVAGPASDDSVVRTQMLDMIEHCPSGALTFRLTAEGNDVEPEFATEIGVVADGPYFVTGAIPVERADGAPFEARRRMTLCRCGQSSNKPLCDGTHKKVGFKDS